ncbi:hypothetical protein Tco_0200511 [Tanacetum coccineum]
MGTTVGTDTGYNNSGVDRNLRYTGYLVRRSSVGRTQNQLGAILPVSLSKCKDAMISSIGASFNLSSLSTIRYFRSFKS